MATNQNEIDSQPNTDKVETYKEELRACFRAFKEDNERFNYQKEIRDKDGYSAGILVDFSIEDYEEGNYYVAYVSSYVDEQPSDDPEKVSNSKAFMRACDVVEYGMRDIVIDRDWLRPEFMTNDSQNGLLAEARYNVVWDTPE